LTHSAVTAPESPTKQLVRLREWGSDLLHALPHTVAAAEESTSNMVIRLREWGTDRFCALPGAPVPDCWVDILEKWAPRLPDLHASPEPRLTYRRQQWWLQALGKASVRQDGALARSSRLIRVSR